MFVLEGARQRARSLQTRERVQYAGVIILLLIIMLALGNDILR